MYCCAVVQSTHKLYVLSVSCCIVNFPKETVLLDGPVDKNHKTTWPGVMKNTGRAKSAHSLTSLQMRNVMHAWHLNQKVLYIVDYALYAACIIHWYSEPSLTLLIQIYRNQLYHKKLIYCYIHFTSKTFKLALSASGSPERYYLVGCTITYSKCN